MAANRYKIFIINYVINYLYFIMQLDVILSNVPIVFDNIGVGYSRIQD